MSEHVHGDVIEKKHNEVMNQLDQELQKAEDDRNFEKILFLIKRSAKLIARLTGKTENQIHMDLTENLKKANLDVAGTYGSNWGRAFIALNVVLQLAGAVAGGAGVYYGIQAANIPGASVVGSAAEAAAKRFSDLAKNYGNAASALNSAGGGVGGIKQIHSETLEKARIELQYIEQEIKRIREERSGSKHRAQQAMDELKRSVEQQASSLHDVAMRMMAS